MLLLNFQDQGSMNIQIEKILKTILASSDEKKTILAVRNNSHNLAHVIKNLIYSDPQKYESRALTHGKIASFHYLLLTSSYSKSNRDLLSIFSTGFCIFRPELVARLSIFGHSLFSRLFSSF